MPKTPLSTQELRQEYTHGSALLEAEIDPNPVAQFTRWFKDAVAALVPLPEAMTLATVSAEGAPDARVVLFKALDDQGLVFFTNYSSPTGEQLGLNPNASCVIWWPLLERQIRIRGAVELLSAEASDAYFKTRPRGAQLATWASQQSQTLANRDELEAAMQKAENQFEGEAVPRPDYWGGYRLVPKTIEFWQGRLNRLHDRLRYRRQNDGSWVIERLAP